MYIKGVSGTNFINYDLFLSLLIALIVANSAEQNEMQNDDAFHLGPHCLPKYPLWGFCYTKG